MKALVALAVLGACWSATPRTPSVPDDRVTKLRYDSHVALVDRDTQLVAGFFMWRPGAIIPYVKFQVMSTDQPQGSGTGIGANGQDQDQRARLNARVASYLGRGNWHPMISAIEVSPRHWSFPGTTFSAVANVDGSIEFRAPNGVFTSPPTARPKGEHPEDDGGTTACALSGVRIQQLAYDPTSHLVWLVFEVDPATGMECLWLDLWWTFSVPMTNHLREPFDPEPAKP